MERNTAVRMAIIAVVALIIGGTAGTQIDTVTQTSAENTLNAYPLELSLAGLHRHDRRNIPADQAPSVSIDVERDPMMPTHFNVHITTEDFTFAPEHVSGDHVLGEGHAHVFVDDVKISRSYGNWYHLPRLSPGTHTIKVTLNTNDHREYAVNGETIQATETVTVSEDAEMNMSMGGMDMDSN